MPARHHVLAIVLFWLATGGWLLYRDVWPWLQPHEPPPYSIDLVDEARQQKLQWHILRDGKRCGQAFTWIGYRQEDDTFELHIELKSLTLIPVQHEYLHVFASTSQPSWPGTLSWGALVLSRQKGESPRARTLLMIEAKGPLGFGRVQVTLKSMDSSYRITRSGELREVNVDLGGDFLVELMAQVAPRYRFQAHVDGQVQQGRFEPRGWVSGPDFDQIDLKIDPVPVSQRGSVLNPLHPVNQITGLKAGQRWRIPLFDPLVAAVSAQAGGGADVQILEAEVRAELFPWRGRPVECYVIEYRGEETKARTWVRASDGLVLRQEANFHSDNLIFERAWE